MTLNVSFSSASTRIQAPCFNQEESKHWQLVFSKSFLHKLVDDSSQEIIKNKYYIVVILFGLINWD